MKNIIVYSADYAIGATGAFHFARFVRDINSMSDHYRVFLLTDDIAKGTPFEIQEADPSTLYSFETHYPPKLFFLGHFIRNWRVFRSLQAIRQRQNVDIVLFNQACMGVLSRWFLPKSIKIIGIIHDDQSLLPAHAAYASRKAFWYHQLIQRPLERLAMRHFDVILANSDYVYRLIASQNRLKPKHLVRLYQSLDIKSMPFWPALWQNTEGGILRILFVKSGFVRGGLQDLIEALGLLTAYKFELTVVGTLPNGNPIIQEWAQPFAHISLTIKGLQDSSAVSELMQSHHVLCIPARHEALGLANAEGLAHGISVVTTAVGGTPEVLDNGQCGWLAPPQNPQALAEILKNCIESPPSVKTAKSQRGRAHVAALFDKQRMLRELLGLFERIV